MNKKKLLKTALKVTELIIETLKEELEVDEKVPKKRKPMNEKTKQRKTNKIRKGSR